MRYLSVRLFCRLSSDAFFPAYAGSMLRGALGHQLRRAFCVDGRKECGSCLLREKCVFLRLFSAPAASVISQEHLTAGEPSSPPFVLEPSPDTGGPHKAGEIFSFALKLFSFAVDYLPFFLHAFIMAGRRGVGAQGERGAGRFLVEDVRWRGESVFDPGAERLTACAPEDLALPELLPAREERLIGARLVTPLRFKAANRLAADLAFSLFLQLILRRVRSLWALEGEDARLDPAEFRLVKELAGGVRVRASDVRWHDWERYSSRQHTLMKLGGLLGEVEYAGPVKAFQEYLALAEKVHIGKQTSFGLGQIALAEHKEEVP